MRIAAIFACGHIGNEMLEAVREDDATTAAILAGHLDVGGWRFDPKRMTLTREDTSYEIDLANVETPADMLGWIFHIAEKEGVFDDASLGRFIRIVQRIGADRWHLGDKWEPAKLFGPRLTKDLTLGVPAPISLDRRSKSVRGVYVFRAGDRPLVKIGSAADIRRRLQELQTANPDKLGFIGLLSSTPADERKWHSRFSPLRVNGEWFALSDSIVSCLYAP